MIATALGLDTGVSSEALYNKLVGFQENLLKFRNSPMTLQQQH